MARIRSIHPGLWTDSAFVGMSQAARLLLIGIWNEADDYGVIAWKPLDLKIRLAPGDNINAAEVMGEIAEAGFLVQISRAGKLYGVVKNFRKFQRPKNPSAPLIPLDDEINAISFGTATPALPQPYPSPTENPPQMEDGVGIGEEEDADDAREAHDEILIAAGIDPAKDVSGKWHGSAQLWEADRWRSDLGLSQREIIAVIQEVAMRRNGRGPPGTLSYFTPAMKAAASRKTAPPIQPEERQDARSSPTLDRIARAARRGVAP